MRRWAAILAVLSAVLAALGYTDAGGAFAELAQMLLFVALGALAVILGLSVGRRRGP